MAGPTAPWLLLIIATRLVHLIACDVSTPGSTEHEPTCPSGQCKEPDSPEVDMSRDMVCFRQTIASLYVSPATKQGEQCPLPAKRKRKQPYGPFRPDSTYVWAAWSHWSECSVTCGTGMRVRVRSCTDRHMPYIVAAPELCGEGRIQNEMEDVCFNQHCLDDKAERVHNYDESEGMGASGEAGNADDVANDATTPNDDVTSGDATYDEPGPDAQQEQDPGQTADGVFEEEIRSENAGEQQSQPGADPNGDSAPQTPDDAQCHEDDFRQHQDHQQHERGDHQEKDTGHDHHGDHDDHHAHEQQQDHDRHHDQDQNRDQGQQQNQQHDHDQQQDHDHHQDQDHHQDHGDDGQADDHQDGPQNHDDFDQECEADHAEDQQGPQDQAEDAQQDAEQDAQQDAQQDGEGDAQGEENAEQDENQAKTQAEENDDQQDQQDQQDEDNDQQDDDQDENDGQDDDQDDDQDDEEEGKGKKKRQYEEEEEEQETDDKEDDEEDKKKRKRRRKKKKKKRKKKKKDASECSSCTGDTEVTDCGEVSGVFTRSKSMSLKEKRRNSENVSYRRCQSEMEARRRNSSCVGDRRRKSRGAIPSSSSNYSLGGSGLTDHHFRGQDSLTSLTSSTYSLNEEPSYRRRRSEGGSIASMGSVTSYTDSESYSGYFYDYYDSSDSDLYTSETASSSDPDQSESESESESEESSSSGSEEQEAAGPSSRDTDQQLVKVFPSPTHKPKHKDTAPCESDTNSVSKDICDLNSGDNSAQGGQEFPIHVYDPGSNMQSSDKTSVLSAMAGPEGSPRLPRITLRAPTEIDDDYTGEENFMRDCVPDVEKHGDQSVETKQLSDITSGEVNTQSSETQHLGDISSTLNSSANGADSAVQQKMDSGVPRDGDDGVS